MVGWKASHDCEPGALPAELAAHGRTTALYKIGAPPNGDRNRDLVNAIHSGLRAEPIASS